MSDIGGIWNPWSTRGRNEKPMNDLIEAASVKRPIDPFEVLDQIVPPQGPSLALAGSTNGAPDYEAIISLAITAASTYDWSEADVFTHICAQTDQWRLLVSSIANRAEDGSARKALDSARKAWRGGLS